MRRGFRLVFWRAAKLSKATPKLSSRESFLRTVRLSCSYMRAITRARGCIGFCAAISGSQKILKSTRHLAPSGIRS